MDQVHEQLTEVRIEKAGDFSPAPMTTLKQLALPFIGKGLFYFHLHL